MKIYYLSATGNSLVTARRLARELDEDVTLESSCLRLRPAIRRLALYFRFILQMFPGNFSHASRE